MAEIWQPPPRSPRIARLYEQAEADRRDSPEKYALSADEVWRRVGRKYEQQALFEQVNDQLTVALAVLVDSARRDGRMNALGIDRFLASVARKIRSRLALADFLSQHPEILEVPIARPIFVVGGWRSGTTLLQRLLAQHDGLRPALAWELMMPIEAATTDPRHRADLIAVAERGHNALAELNPTMMLVHEFRPTLPEECIVAMGTDLKSWFFSNETRLDSYDRWLAEQDMVPSYQLYRCILQVLRWGDLQHDAPNAERRFVLKAPAHLPELACLLSVFPDAEVVWLHRPVADMLPSTASLFAVHRSTRSDEIDPLEVGRFVVDQFDFFMTRGLETQVEHSQIADLRYSDLVADPLSVAASLCKQWNLPTDRRSSSIERFERFLIQNKQHKLGRHSYSAEQFGLEPEALARRFDSYQALKGLS